MRGLFFALFAIYREIDHVTLAPQAIPQRHSQSLFVFYDQDILVHDVADEADWEGVPGIVNLSPSAIGRCSVKVLPTESSLVTVSFPPMVSAIRRANARPRPVP